MKSNLVRAAAILVMVTYYFGRFGAFVRRVSPLGFGLDYWFWFLALIPLGANILFSKSSRLIYLYTFFLLISATFFWMDFDGPFFLLYYLLYLLYSITLYEYFVYTGDIKGINIVIRFAILFIFISCFSAILIYAVTGVSSRMLYRQMTRKGVGEGFLIDSFGGSGITFYYGISLMIPTLVACIKSHPRWSIKKVALTVFLAIVMLALFLAEYTTALLLGGIGFLIALVGRRRFKVSLVLFGALLLLVVFMPNRYKVAIFGQLSDISPGETLSDRFEDVGVTLEVGVGQSDTHISMRADRIPYQLSNFIRSPLIGTGISLEHNFWIDILSRFGIFGMFPIFLVYRRQFLRNFAWFDETFKFYYLITLLIFIVMGIMKNMAGLHFPLAFLFIVPGLYHTDLYNKEAPQSQSS